MHRLRAQIQDERQEQLHQNTCGHRFPAEGTHRFEHHVGHHAHDDAEESATEEGHHELHGRFAHFEYTADGRRDGELETDDAGRVVEQRFAFQHARLPLRQRRFLAERRHRDRIRRPKRCAERQSRGERNRRPYGMQRETDRRHRRDRQTDRQ